MKPCPTVLYKQAETLHPTTLGPICRVCCSFYHSSLSPPAGSCPASRPSCSRRCRRSPRSTSVCPWRTRSCSGSCTTETCWEAPDTCPPPPPSAPPGTLPPSPQLLRYRPDNTTLPPPPPPLLFLSSHLHPHFVFLCFKDFTHSIMGTDWHAFGTNRINIRILSERTLLKHWCTPGLALRSNRSKDWFPVDFFFLFCFVFFWRKPK